MFSGFPTEKKQIKDDVLSGITVALALIPEAVAFAFVAGVSPLISLQTAVVIGLVAAILTGRPWMISSSTAAIAIVIAPLVASYGLEYLFATVLLIGFIQCLLGFFKTWKYTSIIPYSVVLGFLNGLAIVIFLAQFDQFMVNQTVFINGVETIVRTWLPLMDLVIMGGFVLLTMAIIHRFPKLTKAIPSSLVGIGFVTIISVLLNYFGIYHLQTVQDFAGMPLVGALPGFHIPQVPWTRETLKIILPYAIVAALVGLTEATLTLKVIDDMTDTKWTMNKEYRAQGFANIINGFLGGMGGDAMIGQSIINIKSGWRTKLSGIVASLGLLFFILFAGPVVNNIPLASLVGLMFMVVISTFEWETLKYRGKIPHKDLIVIIVVSVVTIFVDLATAVIIWVLLSALIFAWEKGKALSVSRTVEGATTTYYINGIIFFGSVETMKTLFSVNKDTNDVIVDLSDAKVMDFSAIEALNSLGKKYIATGKRLHLRHPGKNCRLLLESAQSITALDIVG